MLVQILVPLRAHLYGGNVLWHEQGMRFSWRVMARAKNGSVTFIVRDPRDGRQWHVSPAKYLTRIQEREMAVQPDLILQLAHHIAREFEARRASGRRGSRRRARVAERAAGRACWSIRRSIWRASRTASAASAGSCRRPTPRRRTCGAPASGPLT